MESKEDKPDELIW